MLASEKLEIIKQKLELLKSQDREFKIFGAKEHQYKLNPCSPSSALRNFEEAHQIELPLEYRLFLLNIGNGGAGPDYGLLPLKYCSSHANPEEGPFSLSHPFPHNKKWNLVGKDTLSTMRIDECKKVMDEYFKNQYINGSIFISNGGCGHETLLVVSGEEKGNIWVNSRVSYGGIYPVCCYHAKPDEQVYPLYDSDERKRIDFLTWYEHWLDVSIHIVETFWS